MQFLIKVGIQICLLFLHLVMFLSMLLPILTSCFSKWTEQLVHFRNPLWV